MTVKLIQKGQQDTNDYENSLNDYGYEDLDKKIKEDAIAVWRFFCSEELVLQGLKKLVEQYFQFNQIKKRTLRQFFDEWGSKNHFNSPSALDHPNEFETSHNFHYPQHTPILYGELTADLFNNVLLKNGYLSADIGAGPIHGKWAHSIQIFLLEEARKEGILQLHAQATCQFIQTISQIKGAYESLSLWSILFDSFDEHIFTYPNVITAVLSSTWDDSEAASFFATKLNSFAEKFNKEAQSNHNYMSFANKKYLSKLNEASYIRYKDKCALLWFAPKNSTEDSSVVCSANESSIYSRDGVKSITKL